MPTNTLKTIQKTHLYSRKPVYLADVSHERRSHNAGGIDLAGLNAADKLAARKNHEKDLNTDERISLFQKQLKSEFVYKIPLRYLSEIGKINFPTKIDYRIKLFLETNMERLLESRKPLADNAKIPAVDAEIIFTKAPFAQYEQILLDKNFRQHLQPIMVSKKILRMGAQKAPIQKTYKIQKGAESLNIEVLGANRGFDWIEISIVPDKSDQHKTIYDSYNREMAAQLIKTLKLSNFSELFSLTNEKKYDTDNITQQHLVCKQFLAWSCNDSSLAPISDYVDNPIFQELPDQETYFSAKSDERIYLDLRASSGYVKEAEKLERNDSKKPLQINLKDPADFNLRVRIWAYSLS